MLDQKQNSSRNSALHYIRTIYLSLAAIIGLICFTIGAVGTIRVALNHWFAVDEMTAYYDTYNPYSESICERDFTNEQGNQEKPTLEQVKDCEEKTAKNELKQNQTNFNRQMSESISLIIAGFPIWLLHFYLIQSDWKRRKEF